MRFPENLALLCTCLFLFSIPWENSVVISAFGTVGRALGALAVVVWLGSALWRGRVARPVLTLNLMLGYLLYSAATYFYRTDANSSFSTALTSVQLAVVALMLWDVLWQRRALLLGLTSLVLGGYVGLTLTILQFTGNRPVVFYERYSAAGFDPNELGLILSLMVPLAWWLGKHVRPVPVRILLMLYPALCLFALFLTASRAALIAYGCTLIYILWDVLRGRDFSAGVRLALLVTLGLSAAAIQTYVPADSVKRLASIGSELAGGNLNSRRDIWAASWTLAGDSPLLGVGVGRLARDLKPYYGEAIVAHNTLITVAVEQGVVGTLIFLLYVAALGASVFRLPGPQRAVWVACLGCLVVGTFTLTWNQRKLTWVLPVLALCAVRAQAEKLKTEAVLAAGGEL